MPGPAPEAGLASIRAITPASDPSSGVVLAIWPAYVPPVMPKSVDTAVYTTPYLDLMQEAIASFGLSEACQEKKESLFEWFRSQEVEGEQVSINLADAMATLIRLPWAQRGGSKRVNGPDLRKAG